MRQNMQLQTIQANMPDYAHTRKVFFDTFSLAQKLGGVNYAAFTPFIQLQPEPSDILAIYLCGVAYGRVQELSEQGENCWDVFTAWALVQGELDAIMPDMPRLPAPAEYSVPSMKRARD